jgi:hypothetical protein
MFFEIFWKKSRGGMCGMIDITFEEITEFFAEKYQESYPIKESFPLL